MLDALHDVLPGGETQKGARTRALQAATTEDVLWERLPEIFHCVRAYHACSPVDLRSYYTGGLRPLTAADTDEWIRRFYLDGRFPELTDEDVEWAIADVGTDYRDGLLWFGLDDRHLARTCGHYLIYGSEYIMSVAASLRSHKRRDYQSCLRGRGIPTIFACDVPLSLLSAQAVREVAQTLLRGIIEHRQRARSQAKAVDHSFALRSTLPPEHIRGHYHPEEVIDWHNDAVPFRYRSQTRGVDTRS